MQIKKAGAGVFQKIQEICTKIGTRISKIDWELSEIIEAKDGNLKNSISKTWGNLSLKSNHFWACDILSYFSRLLLKSTKMKLCP